jgi:ABC-type branched-subunit amino acid transport system ATPase component
MAEGRDLLVGKPLEVMNSKLVQEVYLGVPEDE